eukprot:SAG31_NODE_42107_length_273_cov_0.591954_1_plen_43_part_10
MPPKLSGAGSRVIFILVLSPSVLPGPSSATAKSEIERLEVIGL